MKKLTTKLLSLFLFITAISFIGCKKVLPTNIDLGNTENSITAYPFDWDNPSINYMPTPSGTTILVPWANGSVRGFSDDILYDFKKNDGWELVYNVFNTSTLQANPYFVLYNKYRGLLRIYIYVTTNGFTTSSYLTSGLRLGPNTINSYMLNYIDQDIVDLSVKKTDVTKVEPTQLASNVWYASQYEIAYDPNVASANYQDIGLNWSLKWTNVSTINLGGGLVGSIKGTIASPTSQFNLGGNLITGALNATGLTVFNNNKGTGPDQADNNGLGLPAFVFKGIRDGLNAGLSGLSTVKNLMNVIFGGNSSNSQEVNLTVNANINLVGSQTSSGAFIPDPGLLLGIPGVSNSQTASGYVPAYNQNMGVFYILGKPRVTVTYTQQDPAPNWDGPTNRYYLNNFAIESSSFQFLINPILSNIANVQVINQEVLLPELIADPYNHFYAYTPSIETVGSKKFYNGYTIDGSKIELGVNHAVVHVTLKVTPNNGAPESKIVKTFWADLTQ